MTHITLETLLETRRQLKATCEELATLQGELITGDAAALDRHTLVMEQIQKLKETFIEQQEVLTVRLPNGKRLWSDQYEALDRFASNNKLEMANVLSKIKVDGLTVTECDFSFMNLTTLSGLEGLVRLRKLRVKGNERLGSLQGIPHQAIESICATRCALTGNLSALSGAKKLSRLHVGGNIDLTSLKGIPTQAIEQIEASACGLTGDLSALSGADKLEVLDVKRNGGLTSLAGIPTQAIKVIIADQCGLTGDLLALSGADKLKELNVERNGGLTSLQGIPTEAIELTEASWCNLTGDHTFLSQAQNLQTLHVENNPDLTLDKTKFSSAVRIVQ
jgi:hypothetical protein